ncbi:hypothetical protein scyTo_0016550, partial [Scyliorhinus torazame]|nr:hypothetical protein [Scyliorhinus torazame]
MRRSGLKNVLKKGRRFYTPETSLQIINQPQTQKLKIGDTLLLNCTAIGIPMPRYQWIRNGLPVSYGCERHYKISKVNRDNQGKYRCHVYNDKAEQWSLEADVLIDEVKYPEEM